MHFVFNSNIFIGFKGDPGNKGIKGLVGDTGDLVSAVVGGEGQLGVGRREMMEDIKVQDG